MSVVWLMVSNLWIFSMFFVGRETTDKYTIPYNTPLWCSQIKWFEPPIEYHFIWRVFILLTRRYFHFFVISSFSLGPPYNDTSMYNMKKYIYFPIGSFYPNNLRQPRMVGLQGRPMEDEAKGSCGKIHHSKYMNFLSCFFSSKNHHGWKIQREKTYYIYIVDV